MAQIDHIKISDTTYDIGYSPDSVFTFTSSDVSDGNATSWTTVSKLESGETNSSIFAKISQMFKNIRFLKRELDNIPAPPTVNNATLSLQANGTAKTTFYANDATNRTFNIANGTSTTGNGTISVGGTAVSVYGLGSSAYKTASSSQTNSTSYVPTSSLVYSMNQKLESLITYGTTDIGAGATLSTGTIYCVYE